MTSIYNFPVSGIQRAVMPPPQIKKTDEYDTSSSAESVKHKTHFCVYSDFVILDVQPV